MKNGKNAASLLNTADAAARLGVTESALRQWRYKGTGPTYYKMNGLIGYMPEDIDAFFAASAVVPRAAS